MAASLYNMTKKMMKKISMYMIKYMLKYMVIRPFLKNDFLQN